MSYARPPEPTYIFPCREGVQFGLATISDIDINIFLYKIMLRYRRDDLISRIKQGKELCTNELLKEIKEDKFGFYRGEGDKEYTKRIVASNLKGEDWIIKELLTLSQEKYEIYI